MWSSLRPRQRRQLVASTIRALGEDAKASYRGRRLWIGQQQVAVASPHLGVDIEAADASCARGTADALGLLVRYCDLTMHTAMAPESPLQRVVFDIAEQIRCEARAPRLLKGVRVNLRAAFDNWSWTMRTERVTETHVGLVLFTVVHMIRSRLFAASDTTAIGDLIEETRGELAPLIGTALATLPHVVNDQRAFAYVAREIAEAVALWVGADACAPALSALSGLENFFDAVDIVESGKPGDPTRASVADPDPTMGSSLECLGDYCVFTRAFDRVVRADSLVDETRRIALRSELDSFGHKQAVSLTRLARRLRVALSRPVVNGWHFNTEDGRLDGARLARLVVDPTDRRVFRRDRIRSQPDACVTFLVDNSGSMKRQDPTAVAAFIDTFARAVELAGAPAEVLGFTTRSYSGGEARRQWQQSGRPEMPGRLAEVLHIIYKDADTCWRRARRSLAVMLSPYHYRESTDGEALIWAATRLAKRRESRRIIVVISDGTPTESSTASVNRPGFLNDHLAAVAASIHHQRRIEIVALALDGDLSDIYPRSISVETSELRSWAGYEIVLRQLAR